jgi:hypothetical protein
VNLNPKSSPSQVPNEYQKATTPITHKKRLEKNNFGDGKKDSNIFIDLPNILSAIV